MKTQDSVTPCDGFCCSNCNDGLRAGIAYQRRQAACGAVPAMRLGDGTHRVRRRLIIEENATTAIDLQVDEPRR
jgi:hypothetical protein